MGGKRFFQSDFAFPRGGGVEVSEEQITKLEDTLEDELEGNRSQKRRVRKAKKIQQQQQQFQAGIKEVIMAETVAKRISKKIVSIGDKLWGMVVDIGKMHLRIALPNGLEGRVHASEASDFLATAPSVESKSPTAANMHDYPPGVPGLSSLFFVGQFVRCVVIEDWEPSQEGINPSIRPPIALSLLLSALHKGLKSDSLHEKMLIAGCIMSSEDHGYNVALGVDIDGIQISGFLPHEANSPTHQFSLLPGMLVEFSIKKIRGRHGSHLLSCIPHEVSKIYRKPGLVCDFGEVLPGMMVNVAVEKILPTGLAVSFLDHSGHVNLCHLQEDMVSADWQKEYEIRQVLPARVIQVNPGTRDVSLSLKQHLIDFTLPLMPPLVGQTFEKSRIVRVEPESGILVEIPSESMKTPGFVEKSMMDQELVDKFSNPGLQGSNLKVRVTGFRPMDGLLAACSKQDVMKSGVLSFEDLLPGMVVTGAVVGVEEGKASLIKLADGIRGFVPVSLRDIRSNRVAVKVGLQVACRVVNLHPVNRKVFLTTNKRLVETKLPTVSDWSDVEIGKRTAGWISGKYHAKGLSVQFYGGLVGYISYKILGVGSQVDAAKQYPPGDFISVYITRVDVEQQRMYLSLQKSGISKLSIQRMDDEDDGNAKCNVQINPCTGGQLLPGDLVNGSFQQSYEERDGSVSLVVRITSKSKGIQGEAVLHVSHLSDTPLGAKTLFESLSEGSTLGKLMVLQTEPCVVVSRKASLVNRAETLPSKFDDLQESMQVFGYVSHVSDHLIRVKFLNDLEGVVRRHQFPLQGVPARVQCYKGQTVCCQVLRVSPSNRSFDLTMNTGRTGSTDTTFLQTLFKDIHLAHKVMASRYPDSKKWSVWPKEANIGRIVSLTVKEETPQGWKCVMKNHSGIEALLDGGHSGGGKVIIGSEVRAVVLDISPSRSLIVSLKPELVARKPKLRLVEKIGPGSRLNGVVQMILDSYVVVSVPDRGHEIFFAPAADYNLQQCDVFSVGQRVDGVLSVMASKATGNRALMYIPLGFQNVRSSKGGSGGEGQVSVHPVRLGEKMEAAVAGMGEGSGMDVDNGCEEVTKVESRGNEKEIGKEEEEEECIGAELDESHMSDAESEELEEVEESSDDCVEIEEECEDEPVIMDTVSPATGWGELVLDVAVDGDGKDSKRKRKEMGATNADKKVAKRRVWEEREDRVRKEEMKQVMDDGVPKEDRDFEKLVMEEPNSSYLWIQYMSFLLSMGEIPKARAIAERALESINFREEQEKFNIWVAYMNLENRYGKPPEEAVSKVFHRALPYNDPKKLHSAFLSILEESGRSEMALEALKTMCRKFSQSSKIWVRAIELDVKAGQPGRAKKTLARALKALPVKKHIKVIVKVGLMEFKKGNLERGREIFEGLIMSYPKRLDLWNLYIDQEIRLGDLDRTKALFERATHLQLPAKKIKFLFKRYLQYCKDRGDGPGVQHVKKRAVEYVNRMVAN